jgi:hypothetical protein
VIDLGPKAATAAAKSSPWAPPQNIEAPERYGEFLGAGGAGSGEQGGGVEFQHIESLSTMPLLAFWESNPDEVGQTSIEQIVAMAGDGSLKDGSHCSSELREYLTQADTPKLASYIEHCLSVSFPKGGLVFQDLVNELGRRLDYKVSNGRYQGTINAIGFDGIWTSPKDTQSLRK